MAEPPPRPQIHAMLAELWGQTRPTVLGRVDRLKQAITALRDGTLDAEARDSARADAHKLTGLLGTYGLGAGSDLARTVELRLAAGVTHEDAPELGRLVDGIRSIVERAAAEPSAS